MLLEADVTVLDVWKSEKTPAERVVNVWFKGCPAVRYHAPRKRLRIRRSNRIRTRSDPRPRCR